MGFRILMNGRLCLAENKADEHPTDSNRIVPPHQLNQVVRGIERQSKYGKYRVCSPIEFAGRARRFPS